MKSEKETDESSSQSNYCAKGPRNQQWQESHPLLFPRRWQVLLRGGHQSSLILYSLLEIFVLKFPKHHELKAWLRQTCVPKESYHTFSCIAQTKAKNKCLSPLPWPLWLLLHLYLSPSSSFGFIPSWVKTPEYDLCVRPDCGSYWVQDGEANFLPPV